MKTPIVLFDADGVLTLPEEVFSVAYAQAYGLDPEPFEEFFHNDWAAIVTGQKDLKESIAAHPDLWQWQGSVDDLLEYWFKTEDVRNEELLAVIREMKSKGVPCYLATEQERYRGEYMKNIMFKDLFDGYFITSELGVPKTDPRFFEVIIDELKRHHFGLEPKGIIFFDDSQSKVDTASSVGIDGRLFTGNHQIRAFADML
jgi:putative hydrolase of the HAD superfamily